MRHDHALSILFAPKQFAHSLVFDDPRADEVQLEHRLDDGLPVWRNTSLGDGGSFRLSRSVSRSNSHDALPSDGDGEGGPAKHGAYAGDTLTLTVLRVRTECMLQIPRPSRHFSCFKEVCCSINMAYSSKG